MTGAGARAPSSAGACVWRAADEPTAAQQAERGAMTGDARARGRHACSKGTAFGADGEAVGEVVFNTSMTGYQEILTDPVVLRPAGRA